MYETNSFDNSTSGTGKSSRPFSVLLAARPMGVAFSLRKIKLHCVSKKYNNLFRPKITMLLRFGLYWPWLGRPLAALHYVFPVCGCRHVFIFMMDPMAACRYCSSILQCRARADTPAACYPLRPFLGNSRRQDETNLFLQGCPPPRGRSMRCTVASLPNRCMYSSDQVRCPS